MNRWKTKRLGGYNYGSFGAYFVTACVHKRRNCLGKIVKGQMELNPLGEIVEGQWNWLFSQYEYLTIDEFVVMPNHFHGVMNIGEKDRNSLGAKIKPLPELMGVFKTRVSKSIHLAGFGEFRWQRSYHDRIIRNDEELNQIRNYIKRNPKNWEKDHNFQSVDENL